MISQRQKQAHKSSESIEVFFGIDKNINAIIDFVNGSKHRYNVYADSKGPLYVTKIEALRKAYIKFKYGWPDTIYYRDHKREFKLL